MIKFAIWIRKNNTTACVHEFVRDESELEAILWNRYRDRGWEVEEFTKIA